MLEKRQTRPSNIKSSIDNDIIIENSLLLKLDKSIVFIKNSAFWFFICPIFNWWIINV